MRRSLLSRLYIKESAGKPPYQIDGTYRRFDQRNNLTVGRPGWDEEFKPLLRKSVEVRVKKIKADKLTQIRDEFRRQPTRSNTQYGWVWVEDGREPTVPVGS